MSTPSLASASPRSVLPPTLQPNAIAAMAPPASRGVSAFLAFGCYALLGGAGFAVAHLKGKVTVVPPIVTERGIIDLRNLVPPTPLPFSPPVHQPAVVPAANVPTLHEPVLPGPTVDPVPDTPDRLSTDDHSLDVGNGHAVKNGATGDPKGPMTGDGRIGLPTGTGPVEFAFANVHILSQVQPVYPLLAKVARIQGPVVLRMTIDTQGVPTDVQVVSGPAALQAEAVRAARLWRFVAATVNGQTTPATFQLTIIFSLR